MVGFGNILKPSEVDTSFGTVNYFNEVDVKPIEASIRATKAIAVNGQQVYYLTDDETNIGKPLFNNILIIQAIPLGNPGLLLSANAEVVSNTEINIYVYDQSGLYGASIDVQLLIIGESAV